jgi:WD40 repeat protein
VWALGLSPDGRWVASGDTEGIVRLQASDGRGEPVQIGQHGWRVHDLEFSADGATLVTASGDMTLRVWRIDHGHSDLGAALVLTHDAEVSSARVLDDGRVVSTTYDDTLWIWTIRGEPRAQRVIQGPGLASARVSANGRVVVTRHGREFARAWPLDPSGLRTALLRIPGLCLPPARRVSDLGESIAHARAAAADCRARDDAI